MMEYPGTLVACYIRQRGCPRTQSRSLKPTQPRSQAPLGRLDLAARFRSGLWQYQLPQVSVASKTSLLGVGKGLICNGAAVVSGAAAAETAGQLEL